MIEILRLSLIKSWIKCIKPLRSAQINTIRYANEAGEGERTGLENRMGKISENRQEVEFIKTKPQIDNFDSSDEEDLRNTIGNIPVYWYDELEHIGYDLDGNQIEAAGKKDEIESFIEKMEVTDYWRKVYDRQTNSYITLTDEQVEKIMTISNSRYPVVGYNPYEPFLDIFSSDKEIHPISNQPSFKQSFMPSRGERLLVGKMVHAIKMGWMKPHMSKQKAPTQLYDLWANEDSECNSKSGRARMKMHLPAPKVPLPSNLESYNPPAEFLFDEEDLKKWKDTEPEDRSVNFIPQKFKSLRIVPAYNDFLTERYERCLDLFMAPRRRKFRLNVDHAQLLPELPNPADLRPYPTTLALCMHGHVGRILSLSMEFEYSEILASASDDGTIRLWSVNVGRCLKIFQMKSAVNCIAICPSVKYNILAAVTQSGHVMVMNYECGDQHRVNLTSQLMTQLNMNSTSEEGPSWNLDDQQKIVVSLPEEAKQVVWHGKGDYFATSSSSSIFIHQLSQCRSQKPFTRIKGKISRINFHTSEPYFFIATRKYVRVYDLAKHSFIKKISTGTDWLSCMQLDRHGENLFLGGLDRRFSWIDLQMSNKPWKCVRHHSGSIRDIAFHRRYPLLATASDDGTAIVYHAKVSADLIKEHEFLPVQRLHTPSYLKKASFSSVIFHPSQPWLLAGATDGVISLFSY